MFALDGVFILVVFVLPALAQEDTKKINIHNAVGRGELELVKKLLSQDPKLVNLKNKLFVEQEYGGFKVEKISASFEIIQIDARYAGIKLGIEQGASYQLDASVKYGDIDYPKEANVDRHVSNSSETVKGIIGSDSNTNSSVIISSEYGGINIY